AGLGLDFLHELELNEFPGISYDLPADWAGLAYTNITISLKCDGEINDATPYVNLVLRAQDITPGTSAANDGFGFRSFAAQSSDEVWFRSGGTDLEDGNGSVVLGALNKAGTPQSLDALIAAYPQACIYNYANPSEHADKITPTPAVLFKL